MSMKLACLICAWFSFTGMDDIAPEEKEIRLRSLDFWNLGAGLT